MFIPARFIPALAAGSAVLASFAIGMAPMVAHADAVPTPYERVEMDDNGVPTLRVPYDGLDLTNAQGRDEMNHRIARAATRVCEPLRVQSIEAGASIEYQTCRREAIARGQAEIEGVSAH